IHAGPRRDFPTIPATRDRRSGEGDRCYSPGGGVVHRSMRIAPLRRGGLSRRISREQFDTRKGDALKNPLLKATFILSILFLTAVFLVPASILLDLLTPAGRTPGGHYKSLDRGFLAVPLFALCLMVSNRIISALFLCAGLSGKRWSIFARRTFG